MKNKKLFIPILFFILLSSCSKKNDPNVNLTASRSTSADTLAGLRVQSLFVVIFESDFTPEAWVNIFHETNALSLNQKKLRELSGNTSPESQSIRAELIGKNAALLTDLGNQSLFMMSWSSENENCKISKNNLKMNCKPFNVDNPLNGGLPVHSTPLTWITPNPVTEDIKTQYLKITLEQNDPNKGPTYSLVLRLKTENITDKEYWLKGDVLPQEGSRFLRQDGTISEKFYPYGYAEMTLAK